MYHYSLLRDLSFQRLVSCSLSQKLLADVDRQGNCYHDCVIAVCSALQNRYINSMTVDLLQNVLVTIVLKYMLND